MELQWFLFVIVMTIDAFTMIAVFSKYREVKRAALWLPAQAKVVSSRSEARRVDKSSGTGKDRVYDSEIRNFAVVTYAFRANGQRHEGNRISIGHDVGNYQVAEKLARYPKGAAITIFYDSAKPENNVIERELSARSFEIAFLIGALIALAAVFFILISGDVATRFSQYLPHNGRESGAVFLVVIGVLMVIVGFGIYQRGATTYAWPKTEGTIASSEVDSVKYRISYRRYGRLFRARTIYDYRVAGVTYQSDRMSFGAQSYASLKFLVRDDADRFVAGAKADVYYDPAHPDQAVLVQGAPGQFIIWAGVILLFAFAAWLSGVF